MIDVRADRLPLRVLVADDSPTIAGRLCEFVADLGAVEVIGPASDGGAALALFEQHRPHVALLDVSMPVLDGIQVARAMRATGWPCVIALCTNHVEPGLRAAGLAAGADHFFNKSLELDLIGDVISRKLADAARPRITDAE